MQAFQKAPWTIDLIRRGLVYHASFASETTPIAFAAYDQDRPDITVSAPSGTLLIPLLATVYLEDSAGTDVEVIHWCTDVAVGTGTSTAITEGPDNLNSGSANTTACTVRRTHTANVTLTDYREFDRWGSAFADATTSPPYIYRWAPAESGLPPLIVGPGTWCVSGSATTTQPNAFATLYWAELASADL